MARTVLLLSGGIDSGVLAHWLRRRGDEILPLFVDYGQRPVAIEQGRAARIAATVTPHELGVLHCPVLHALRSGTDGALLWSQTFLPQRNLLLLTLAAMWAARHDADRVALGAVHDPRGRFPDTTPAFIEQAASALEMSHAKLVLDAPFATWHKEQVAVLGFELGLRLEDTWSCTRTSSETACGRCGGCEERHVAEGAYAGARARLSALDASRQSRKERGARG